MVKIGGMYTNQIIAAVAGKKRCKLAWIYSAHTNYNKLYFGTATLGAFGLGTVLGYTA